MTVPFEIRDIQSEAEFRAVEQLQRDVWGFADLDVLPGIYFRSVMAAGGILLGAFDGNELAAFVFGFPGYRHGQCEMHSDMLAVRDAYRDQGLGYRLKLAQRARCLQVGIRVMTWTFDPLRARNAHFNFAKLGALSDSYRVNFYGESTSSFLHGNGTDRLWVTWLLDRDRSNGPPAAERARIAVPKDIGALSPEEQWDWRLRTRDQFTQALDAGYCATGFENGAYVLEKGRIEDFR